MMPRHYFAYGSNMNPDRVFQRGLTVVGARSATISGLALRFNKASRAHPDEAHANLSFAPGVETEGVLYELAGDSEILLMDRFENAPVNYSREVVRVVGADGETAIAWTYFANPAVVRDGLLPSREYLDHLLAGRAYLSDAYFQRLSRWPTSKRR